MQSSRNKMIYAALAVVVLLAAWRVAMPLYDSYRAGQVSGPGAVRPNAQIAALLSGVATVAASDDKFPCLIATLSDAKPAPQLGQCDLPTERSGQVDQVEADLRFGNLILRQTDLYLNDVFEVPLTRSYNSGDYLQSSRVHAFGRNATHPFDIAPVGTRYPYTYQLLVLEDGNAVYFPRVSPGTSYADAVFQHTDTSNGYYKAVTGWNGNGWTMWRTDGTSMVFPEAYNSKNAAQGAAVELRDGAGNKLQLLRDDERNLEQIVTPHKRTIKLQYDLDARITRADDDKGNWAEYHYDDYGMLTDAILSSGRERHYTYADELMTSITDEKHQVLLRNAYTNKRLVQQDFGNGQTFSYSYMPSDDGTYAESVIVTLPDGSTSQIETGSAVPGWFKQPPK